MTSRKTRTPVDPVVIVGAGLAGSLLAVMLAERGIPVVVAERRPDLRTASISAGRSINLALSTRGITALEAAGIDQEVLRLCVPMPGRMIHNADATLRFQAYGRRGQAIRSVSRRDLNGALLTAAERAGASIEFETHCEGIDPSTGHVTLVRAGGSARRLRSRFIIGADGAHSAVRKSLSEAGLVRDSETVLDHVYKELTIHPGPDGRHAMTPEALHIWPRHEFMLIALPNLDGSFTLTLFVAADGKTSFAAIEEVGAARRFFAEHFADALALMPDFDEQWSSNPRSRLSHVTTDRFHAGTRCILLGDAAHAIVPFYGQGMNAAFEDCRILMDLLDENDGRFDARLCESFTAARKPNADAIRDLALENFVEMRDKVAHPAFHLRKKLDAALHELAPHHYIPLYTMVTFSNIPYAEARARAKRQDRLLSMGLRLVGAAGLGAAIAVAGRVAGRDTSA